MARYFNVTGACYPDEHYMVKLDKRLQTMKTMVDQGKYITINRARQYGKTTTLWALHAYLQEEYAVVLMDFQRMSTAIFRDEYTFSKAFMKDFLKVVRNKNMQITGLPEQVLVDLEAHATKENYNLRELFEDLSDLCYKAEKKVVLVIDEVDSASNNVVFLDFLSQLRNMYLEKRVKTTFQSVILAGVYDVKNLKSKIRTEEGNKLNSPWNIAVDLKSDMSFGIEDIKEMLSEYESEHRTGMDITKIAVLIYDYTSGYPFLVSRICKIMDEELTNQEKWNAEGVKNAVKELLKESNTLFDDMRKKIVDDEKLRKMLYEILFLGKTYAYNPDSEQIDKGRMFGFIKEENGNAVIANRIYETRLYNMFLSEEMLNSDTYEAALIGKNQFVHDGKLNMDLVMKKFVEHFSEVYADEDEKFIEENGRRLFLLYLKPIINGTGNYYIEARTRNMQRTDVIIDYQGKQYIVELKIWRGNAYHEQGEQQLLEYLDAYQLDRGYLLSFCFNKGKKAGVREVKYEDKTLVEAVV